MLTMGNTLWSGLVHLLGLQHTAIHHDVRQIREEQDALVETGGKQCASQLAQYGNANEQWIRTVAQHELIPQMQDLVQRENICNIHYTSLKTRKLKDFNRLNRNPRENMVRNQGMANSSGMKLMLAKCRARSGS